MKLTIYTDGGARGNPGPSGIGVCITDEKGNKVKEISEHIGNATNNQAEYGALVRGLEEAKKLKADEISIFMDSELVVKQVKQEYKVKDKDYITEEYIKSVKEVIDPSIHVNNGHTALKKDKAGMYYYEECQNSKNKYHECTDYCLKKIYDTISDTI